MGPRESHVQLNLNACRGQTLPFWAIGTMITLALLFFLANYVSAIGWQIRAQNAVDSDASAALSVQANLFNEESTILYAAALDEYRLRYLNQAILNTIAGVGGCENMGSACDADYQSLVQEYNVALNGFTDDIHLMGQADQLSEGGQQQDERKAANGFASNCGQAGGGVICDFAVSVLDVSRITSNRAKNEFAPTELDVVACRNVPYFVPLLFKFGAGASHKVVARGAASVYPTAQENFQPGVAINPATGLVYQPSETQWAVGYSAPAYTVDFTHLTVNLNWYQVAPVKPYSGTITAKNYSCL